MTPKEKAKELKEKFLPYVDWMNVQTDETDMQWALRNSKNCALIVVDEVLNNYYKNHFQTGKKIDYWKEVKQEIQKL